MNIIKYSLVICLAAFGQMAYGQERTNLSENMLDLQLQLDELQMELTYLEEIHAASMRDLNSELISARQTIIQLEKAPSNDINAIQVAYDALSEKRSQILTHKRDYVARKEFLTDEIARLSDVQLCGQNNQTNPNSSSANKAQSGTSNQNAPQSTWTPSSGSCGKKQCNKPAPEKKAKRQCCYVAPQPCPQPNCQKPCKEPKPCKQPACKGVPPAQSTQGQGQPCPQPNCPKPCKEPKPCQPRDCNGVPPAQSTQAQPCPKPNCPKPCKPCQKPCVTQAQPAPQNALPPPCNTCPKQNKCVQSKMCQKSPCGKSCQRKCATPPVRQKPCAKSPCS